jgi:hypothetical protein
MENPKHPINDLETLLRAEPFEVPLNFESRVLVEIARLPQPSERNSSGIGFFTHAARSLRWLALAGSGLLAAAELLTFIFGFWSATNAF